MSSIIESYETIMSKEGGSRFGIKPFEDKKEYGIILPIDFSMRDFSKFGRDLSGMYSKFSLVELKEDKEYEVSVQKAGEFSIKAKYKITRQGDGSIKIRARKSSSGVPRFEDLCLIDNSLYNSVKKVPTVLGIKLVMNWLEPGKISPISAVDRVKALTKYSGSIQ
jgi:hypothetical protein